MPEFVLTGGEVVDGTSAPRFAADVVVTDDRISAIAPPGTLSRAGPVIDVTGLVVAPGFIDMHAHSDLAVLADPAHEAKVSQGVTCEVLGQDGLSYAPSTEETLPQLQAQLAAWNGTPDLDYSWRSVGEYLDRIDLGSPVNVAYLVPHGNVRMTVLGTEDRAPTEGELQSMQRLVANGLAEGAVGLSAGLTYTPGMYAEDDELVRLCAPVAHAGGFYCPHHRNYGSSVLEGYAACLRIARRAEVALHLAHCHVNFPENAGRAQQLLDMLDTAVVEENLDLSLDSYPYLAGATYLAALLPSWAHSGGPERVLERLHTSESRARIIHELEVQGTDGNQGMRVDWATVTVSAVSDPRLNWAVGASLQELGARYETPPGQLYCDLLVADHLGSGCLLHVGNEDNVQTVMRHTAHTGGSDGILVGQRPHPRGWGTFPRYLGTYVRELGVFGLEECIAHLTSRPARRLGLTDRGVLRVGAKADIAVVDPQTVAATATYAEPRQLPEGIQHVLVNGVFTVRDRVRTQRVPGHSLRPLNSPGY